MSHRIFAVAVEAKAGFTRAAAQTGAVTLIQRFGWYGNPAALNLNTWAAPYTFTCSFSTASMLRTGMENCVFTG